MATFLSGHPGMYTLSDVELLVRAAYFGRLHDVKSLICDSKVDVNATDTVSTVL